MAKRVKQLHLAVIGIALFAPQLAVMEALTENMHFPTSKRVQYEAIALQQAVLWPSKLTGADHRRHKNVRAV